MKIGQRRFVTDVRPAPMSDWTVMSHIYKVDLANSGKECPFKDKSFTVKISLCRCFVTKTCYVQPRGACLSNPDVNTVFLYGPNLFALSCWKSVTRIHVNRLILISYLRYKLWFTLLSGRLQFWCVWIDYKDCLYDLAFVLCFKILYSPSWHH